MLLSHPRLPQIRGSPSHVLTRLGRFLWQYRIPLGLLFLAALLEVRYHTQQYAITRPEHDLDKPFYTQCQEPAVDKPRENATFVMLVRNRELGKALKTVHSIEKHFNQWFHYPIVFLNDEPWTDEFMRRMNETASGGAIFEVLTQDEWGFPEFIDPNEARESIYHQGKAGIIYAGLESYHHMCRFYSGKFYNTPALRPYKWYWRIEPDVDFYCALTYDPFVEMARHRKTYGFTIALAESPRTCPSLFRHMADYKEAHDIPTTTLWKAMVAPSWVPWPFRSLLSSAFNVSHTDRHGDGWNLCHYWSNFEIADMDFFRGGEYQNLVKELDKSGGFYFERWGDAPVHSLALAMLLDAEKIHYFQDIGYRHDWFSTCPANAPGEKQLPLSRALELNKPWAPEGRPDDPDAIGCRCECEAGEKGTKLVGYPSYCTRRLTMPNKARRGSWWF
ncbi:family 15 putative glycosyltransferase [Naviculisporaceae sp. PSN 640]